MLQGNTQLKGHIVSYKENARYKKKHNKIQFN